MATIARVVVPDFPYHVGQRGARAMDVFFSAEDRAWWSNVITKAEIHLICIDPNQEVAG